MERPGLMEWMLFQLEIRNKNLSTNKTQAFKHLMVL